MNYEILYMNDSEKNDYESYNKGYRNDVLVIIGEKKYKLYITDMVRLVQDYESEVEVYGYYYTEPNTIIVREVTKSAISYTIEQLVKCGYFQHLGYEI